jgi:hypothetical protein
MIWQVRYILFLTVIWLELLFWFFDSRCINEIICFLVLRYIRSRLRCFVDDSSGLGCLGGLSVIQTKLATGILYVLMQVSPFYDLVYLDFGYLDS